MLGRVRGFGKVSSSASCAPPRYAWRRGLNRGEWQTSRSCPPPHCEQRRSIQHRFGGWQHSTCRRSPTSWGPSPGVSCCYLHLPRREYDSQMRARRSVFDDLDAAGMGIGIFADDGEAEAGTFHWADVLGVALEEGFEDLVAVFELDAGAVVDD